MDDSLVAPESRPVQSPLPPTPPTPPSQPQAAPQPKRASFQSSKAFIVIPIVLIIIIIAAGAFLITGKHATPTSVSTTIANPAAPATVSVSASTTISSSAGANSSACPCLSEQQLSQILVLSAAGRNHAVFNLTFAKDNAAVRALQTNNSAANSTSLPNDVLDNVTEGWVASYNASLNGSASELVLKSSNINSFISYFDSQTNPSNTSALGAQTGTVNGFHYIYFNMSLFGANIIGIEGYKDSYIIAFELGTPDNATLASESNITSEISGAA